MVIFGNGGFTLLELIIVIAILAILVALAVLNFGGVMSNAKQTAIKADLKQLETAVQMYNQKYNFVTIYIIIHVHIFCNTMPKSKLNAGFSDNNLYIICYIFT